jgi:hypothetical protein
MTMTSHKAWAGALATLVTYATARLGFGEMPALDTVEAALTELVQLAGSAVTGWVLVFLTRNKVQATGARHRAAPLACLIALVLAVVALGGCAYFATRDLEGVTPPLKVYAAKQDFRVTLAVPSAYEALPRCQGVATAATACSNTTVVQGLRKAVVLARDSLDQADAAALAGQPDVAIYIGTATSTLTSVYAILGTLLAPTGAEGTATGAPAAPRDAKVAAPAVADWRLAAAALRDIDRPSTRASPEATPGAAGAATGSAALAATAIMKGLGALLVALPVGSATYIDARQTKALVEAMAQAGQDPSTEQRAQLNAAIGLLVDQILAD